MKIAIPIFIIIAAILIIYNATFLDFSNVFEGESFLAIVQIFALLSLIVLLLIFRVSKRIEKKVK